VAGGLEKLGLGSAQFGLDYGVSNTRGRTPDAEVEAILARALDAGVRLVDTASAYGEAEATLGAVLPSPCPFRIVTKTAPGGGPEMVENAARASLNMLWLPSAYALLVHSAKDLAGDAGPALWGMLERLKGEGRFEKIGISAYASDDPVALARRYRPDVMQLPVSLLDQSLIQNGALETLAGMGVEVHLRSIFLQGLLFVPLERLPGRLGGSAARLKRVRLELAEAGVDPVTAAVRFALDRPEAAHAVVGVTGLDELEGVLAAAATRVPDLDWAAMALDDPLALDPRRWAA
jgi:aryl-alcohol dehydrogenase-like predicted oxidoreductase